MAQIIKMSGYLVDTEGQWGGETLKDVVEAATGTISQQLHLDFAEIPDWSGEHPLMHENCDLAHCEKHFPKDPTLGMEKRMPVEDGRKPDDFKDVLCWYEYFRYGDYNCMHQTYGIGHYDSRIDWWGGFGSKSTVLAWRPLPEPYREEES